MTTAATLTGIAIIGKSNEPLYLCDCELLPDGNGNCSSSSDENDPFGFASAARAAKRHSLPHGRQILAHAALDCLEEMVEVSATGQMPVIRNATRSVPHWVGLLLLESDGQAVYGYITATNIKFMALTRGGQFEPKVMQAFLAELHHLYGVYISNPFCNTRGPICSTKFDEGIGRTVAKIQQSETLVD